tara:strand:+ start:1472 stop:1867 length:396 start_codon:yes stop_codon:yes gene_type:complete
MKVNIDISIGDFIDRYSILLVKASKITDEVKMEQVIKELQSHALIYENIIKDMRRSSIYHLESNLASLVETNTHLWNILDRQRKIEEGYFDPSDFIELSRCVYKENDHRFKLKKSIDKFFDSDILEQKQYV